MPTSWPIIPESFTNSGVDEEWLLPARNFCQEKSQQPLSSLKWAGRDSQLHFDLCLFVKHSILYEAKSSVGVSDNKWFPFSSGTPHPPLQKLCLDYNAKMRALDY